LLTKGTKANSVVLLDNKAARSELKDARSYDNNFCVQDWEDVMEKVDYR